MPFIFLRGKLLGQAPICKLKVLVGLKGSTEAFPVEETGIMHQKIRQVVYLLSTQKCILIYSFNYSLIRLDMKESNLKDQISFFFGCINGRKSKVIHQKFYLSIHTSIPILSVREITFDELLPLYGNRRITLPISIWFPIYPSFPPVSFFQVLQQILPRLYIDLRPTQQAKQYMSCMD